MPKVEIACEYCGKKALKKPSNIKDRKHHFCSHDCYHKWVTGKNNPMFGIDRSGEKSAFLGRKHTPEAKERNRIAHLKENLSPLTIEKMSIAGKRRVHTSESNSKRSISLKGKRSGSQNPMFGRKGKDAPRYGLAPPHGKGVWVVSRNEELWLRSSYEIRVVKVLEQTDIQWQYESIAFPISINGVNDATYRPDFWFKKQNVYWEIKGYWRDDARKKVLTFMCQYPEEHLRILYKHDIDLLEETIALHEDIDPASFGTNEII